MYICSYENIFPFNIFFSSHFKNLMPSKMKGDFITTTTILMATKHNKGYRKRENIIFISEKHISAAIRHPPKFSVHEVLKWTHTLAIL